MKLTKSQKQKRIEKEWLKVLELKDPELLEYWLDVENVFLNTDREKYMEWLNQLPLKERRNCLPQTIRDGLILFGAYCRVKDDPTSQIEIKLKLQKCPGL